MNQQKIEEDGRLIESLLEKAHRERRTARELGRLCGKSGVWASAIIRGKITTLRAATRADILKYLDAPDDVQADYSQRFSAIRRRAFLGTGNPRWNGGNSQYPDHALFKIRRLECLRLAKGKCGICGAPARVVHHEDGNKANHDLSNLMALCKSCHWALHTEDWHDLRQDEVGQ